MDATSLRELEDHLNIDFEFNDVFADESEYMGTAACAESASNLDSSSYQVAEAGEDGGGIELDTSWIEFRL